MVKYFFKKISVSLILLALSGIFVSTDNKVFECSLQTLKQLCETQNKVPVCANDNKDVNSTFDSACQACMNKGIVSYTQGACTCSDSTCNSQQTCVEGVCVKTSELNVNQLSEIAQEYLSQQKHAQALKYLQKVLKLTQQDPSLFYLSALASFANDQPKQCLKFIKKAIQLNPDVPEYYIIRGRAFSQINQCNEAEKQFQKVLEIGFDDMGLVYFYQAQNLLKSERNQEAIRKFELAIAQHPQKPEWYLRKAFAHLINKEYKMALLTCMEGLKVDPDHEQIKLFMNQFKNIDEGKQKDLQNLQQKNLFADEKSKQNFKPEDINRLIQQRKDEEMIKFEKQRQKQRKKAEENQKTEKNSSQL